MLRTSTYKTPHTYLSDLDKSRKRRVSDSSSLAKKLEVVMAAFAPVFLCALARYVCRGGIVGGGS